MVLLKNEGNLLPLDAGKVKTIAVIGPNAYPATPTAGGSGKVPTFNPVSFLAGISDELGTRVNVTYLPGLNSIRMMTMLTSFATAASGGPARCIRGSVRQSGARGCAGGSSCGVAVRDRQSRVLRRSGFPADARHAPTRSHASRAGWTDDRAHASSVSGGGRDGSRLQLRAITLFVQNTAVYRVFVDDRLVIDSSRIPYAAVRRVKLPLDARARKVVFEQGGCVVARGAGRFLASGGARCGMMKSFDPNVRKLAAAADAVVVAVGFDADSETEGADREFALPPGRDRLIQEVAAANRNTVVVVTAGGGVDVDALDRRGAWVGDGLVSGAGEGALLSRRRCWVRRIHPGGCRSRGSGLRRINPSASSYYYNDPAAANRIVYKDGVFVGYRGYQRGGSAKPQFPFGFGLSYTTFEYSGLGVVAAPAGAAAGPGSLKASYVATFDVKNAGSRNGADVAQLYVAPGKSKVERPKRELKGFARVELAPGETRTVSVPLDARAFAYYDVKAKRWVADAGSYAIEVGRSSEDIRATANVTLSRAVKIEVGE